ncbi:holin-like protein [Lachnospiraceae bacterium PM6-15]|uniref:CidA/LrgA family protein n=1 Tax=Ohessyouella blattaphilus TaxID=2949333 RepID=A0ABT1EFF3_9FIRM|nr:CidA/LrgA family protein [Ohessyouella blattaphilus]MCP1109420.1 CidA/LrgA family protein [Ohessyouella blattaphilus]MCR8562814.1 CidA/LrgA family protein [Ohessyouella blattaphilus]MDL2249275.1 CidA/LrgA family protein [Lachnospiraceae bacterium OttesenSCG-928-J05]
MKVLKQIGIIFLVCLLSEGIKMLLPFSFPSSVIAILLLTAFLGLRIIKEKQIKETGDFLLENMGIVFVPLNVTIVEQLKLLEGQLVQFFIVAIASLFLSFFVTYFTVRFVQILMGKMDARRERS